MSNPSLAINFNVFDLDAQRSELQKAQAYINQLNSLISTLQDQVTQLQKQVAALS